MSRVVGPMSALLALATSGASSIILAAADLGWIGLPTLAYGMLGGIAFTSLVVGILLAGETVRPVRGGGGR